MKTLFLYILCRIEERLVVILAKINVVISDLSEVLIPGFDGVGELLQEHALIRAEIFDLVRWRINSYLLETMRGKHREVDYLNTLTMEGCWRISPRFVGRMFRENFLREYERSALGVIERLAGKYRLVLLSDHIAEWGGYILENRKELEMFDELIFSYQLGAIKSDPGTFGRVLEVLDVAPDECVFIDDMSVNVVAAQSCGISSVLYTGTEDLVRELTEDYGIKM